MASSNKLVNPNSDTCPVPAAAKTQSCSCTCPYTTTQVCTAPFYSAHCSCSVSPCYCADLLTSPSIESLFGCVPDSNTYTQRYFYPSLGQRWNHVALTYYEDKDNEQNSETNVFYNGMYLPLTIRGTSLAKKVPYYVIAYIDKAGAKGLMITNYKIWRKAFYKSGSSLQQIKLLMAGYPKSGSDLKDLMAFYKFDEDQDLHYDYSLYKNHLIYENSARSYATGHENLSPYNQIIQDFTFAGIEGEYETMDYIIDYGTDHNKLGAHIPIPNRFWRNAEFMIEFWATMPDNPKASFRLNSKTLQYYDDTDIYQTVTLASNADQFDYPLFGTQESELFETTSIDFYYKRSTKQFAVICTLGHQGTGIAPKDNAAGRSTSTAYYPISLFAPDVNQYITQINQYDWYHVSCGIGDGRYEYPTPPEPPAPASGDFNTRKYFRGTGELMVIRDGTYPSTSALTKVSTVTSKGRIYYQEQYNSYFPLRRGSLGLGRRLLTNNYFLGSIREFRVWSTFRNKIEIIRNMHQRLRGSIYGNLVAYFPLNDNRDFELYDHAYYEKSEISELGRMNPYSFSIVADHVFINWTIPYLDTSQSPFVPMNRNLICKNHSVYDYKTNLCLRGQHLMYNFNYWGPTFFTLATADKTTGVKNVIPLTLKSIKYDAETTAETGLTIEAWIFNEYYYTHSPTNNMRNMLFSIVESSHNTGYTEGGFAYDRDNNRYDLYLGTGSGATFTDEYKTSFFWRLAWTTTKDSDKWRRVESDTGTTLYIRRWHHLAFSFKANGVAGDFYKVN